LSYKEFAKFYSVARDKFPQYSPGHLQP